jgi:lysozyme
VIPDVPVPKPMLKKGSKGEAVKEMQSILISKGYDLGKWGADGAFGKQTLAAVKAFQKDCGIKVDGIVGKDTWSWLMKEAKSI